MVTMVVESPAGTLPDIPPQVRAALVEALDIARDQLPAQALLDAFGWLWGLDPQGDLPSPRSADGWTAENTDRRAVLAAAALGRYESVQPSEYAETSWPPQQGDSVVDLIADLLHYAHQLGLDKDACLRLAYRGIRHFTVESAETQ